MYLRLSLVTTALLTVAVGVVSAEELQLTFSGVGCAGPVCSNGPGVPFSLSYDFNSNAGRQSAEFFQVGGVTYLERFDVTNLGVTNFRAVVGGVVVASDPRTTGAFEWGDEAIGAFDFNGAAPSAVSGGRFFFDGFAPLTVTQAQFQAFKDPFTSMLEMSAGPPGTDVSLAQLSEGPPLGPGDIVWDLAGKMTVTPVPEPGVLPLLLLGLMGVGVVRRWQGSSGSSEIGS